MTIAQYDELRQNMQNNADNTAINTNIGQQQFNGARKVTTATEMMSDAEKLKADKEQLKLK